MATKSKYISYARCCIIAQSLSLGSMQQWSSWYRTKAPTPKFINDFGKRLQYRTTNIPPDPSYTYRNAGWVSWPEFLGTKNVDYQSAMEYAHNLHLDSVSEWWEYASRRYPQKKFVNSRGDRLPYRPHCIPANISDTYDEHVSYRIFLNTDHSFMSYSDAMRYMQYHNITSKLQWFVHYKKHSPNIPHDPHLTYSEFTTYGDFFGTGRIQNQQKRNLYLPPESAKHYIRSLNLTSGLEYSKWQQKHQLPTLPRSIYEAYGRDNYGPRDELFGFTAKLASLTSTKPPGILYIARVPDNNENIFEIDISYLGKYAIEQAAKSRNMRLLRLLPAEMSDVSDIKRIISYHGHDYNQRNHYAIRNIHQMLFDIDILLD